MSRAIWKFPIKITDMQHIEVPGALTPLHVAFQGGQLCLWGAVWPGYSQVRVPVYIIGTGHPYDVEEMEHVGTVQDGLFVWHVFVGPRENVTRP